MIENNKIYKYIHDHGPSESEFKIIYNNPLEIEFWATDTSDHARMGFMTKLEEFENTHFFSLGCVSDEYSSCWYRNKINFNTELEKNRFLEFVQECFLGGNKIRNTYMGLGLKTPTCRECQETIKKCVCKIDHSIINNN